MTETGRPLLFLDVDGPLIPFGSPQGHRSWPPPVPSGSNPLLSRLDPGHGRRLSALPCDLVWATTWMDDANEVICPRLGLPELPVVRWPDSAEEDGPPYYGKGPHRETPHWKTQGLIDWAAGRPFVWVDDEITGADHDRVSAHHAGRALLHRVDPRTGLTDRDFTAIGEWLARAHG